MLALKWRPRAQLDRESIAIYLGVERKNPELALQVINELDEGIQRIQEMPGIGACLDLEMLDHHEYRRYVCGNYYIYYSVITDAVIIWRILHQRQNIDTYTLI